MPAPLVPGRAQATLAKDWLCPVLQLHELGCKRSRRNYGGPPGPCTLREGAD
jgi:hypothetical protein